MAVYYNEVDPRKAAGLREAIKQGLIADGEVDERSIRDVRADDVRGFTQCHWFAGLGGWSYALRLAGWPDDRPVWSGSCPCQDFSIIGKRKGFSGARDLWPAWFRLVGECPPNIIFGEQVDKAPQWIDRCSSDLEGIGYAFGAAVIPALAAGAQHERLRLYFVADADAARWADAGWIAAAKTQANVGASLGMVYCEAPQYFQRPLMPDESWVVDGLSGEGDIVSAYGDAIVAPLAAEFIRAVMT